MNKKDYLIVFLLFIAGIFLRAPFVENMQSHWDGPQYSIAVIHYSFADSTPATPGYPLYIALARLFYFLLSDPHKALLLESVLFSGIGAVVFYLAGKLIFNRIVGLISSLIFLSGSTFYYFGLTAYAYIIFPVATTLLASIVYLIFFKKRNYGFLLGLIFAIILGFRPQEIFFVAPLFVLGYISLIRKEKLLSIFSLVLFIILWIVPFLYLVGGVESYFSASVKFAGASLPGPSLTLFPKYLELMFKGYWLTFGLAGFFIVFYLKKIVEWFKKKSKITDVLSDKKVIFFSVWLLPCFLFNLFIRTEHAGYQMSYLSALNLLIAYALWRTFRKKVLLTTAVILIVISNLLVFFVDRDPNYNKPYRPTSFHYSDIRKNDRKLGGKVNFIKNTFDPKSTLIISTPTLWRPIMYHLPEYFIFEFDGLVTDNEKFKFTRRDSKNWKFQEYQTKTFKLIVPEGVNTIVLIDDEYNFRLNNIKKEDHYIDNVNRITYFSVQPKDTIIYGLGFLSRI